MTTLLLFQLIGALFLSGLVFYTAVRLAKDSLNE